MQKLLRRSVSTPILCTTCNPSLPLPLSFGNSIARNRNRLFFSSPFKNKRKASVVASYPTSPLSTPQLIIMPAATVATGSSLASPFSQKPSSLSGAAVNEKSFAGSSRFFATVSAVGSRDCWACQCLIERGTQSRAWVVLKEGRSGHRAAWLHTGSDGSLSSTAVEGKRNPDTDLRGNGGEEDENVVEDKPLRLNRRQKGLASGGGIPGNLDLLTIPGVGPRNLRKLVENGIAGVAELKQLYKDKFFGKSCEKMVEYLQSSVGIIHKNHAESITTFIKKTVDEELEDGSGGLQPIQKNRITLCVEGNISVGKTTFLQRIANETIELRDLVEIVPEPINKWQDIGPDHFNILDAFYAEPERYAYTFQNYVFVTRVMQERESSGGLKPLRLMERSVFSDRMVFVRAVHEANWMNEMEISIYDSWFDPVVSCLPGLIPDGFIYLRASPDTCHNRMKLRRRAEEGGVSLEYLRDLHEKHERWLFPFESGNHGVLSVSKLPLHIDSSLPPQIRDRVFYLEGNHMHPSIQKVPALVLDCEPNIDFSKDIEAKSEYARQVAEFFEFVKKKKEVTTSTETGEAARNAQSQILLPQKSGLWVPNGNHFPESGFKSLDFRRAMSFMSG